MQGQSCATNMERNMKPTVVANGAHRMVGIEVAYLKGELWEKKERELDWLSTVSDPDLLLLDEVSEPKLEEGSEPKLKKARKENIEEEGSEMDYDDKRVYGFRRRWNLLWSRRWGSFDDITMTCSMPFTFFDAPQSAYPCDTIQIFSVQVAQLFGGLKFPLDVFGFVALRDSMDHRRNLVFYRTRDNCQTLTEKDPYLALTGPTRAVVPDKNTSVAVEIDLKVRGKVESEDIYLSFFARELPDQSPGPLVIHWNLRSKCSSMELKFACISDSVEATIFIRVTKGSWPDGVYGQITADCPLVEHEKLVLLEFGADDVPVNGSGYVELSRQVVSVSLDNVLLVSCNACKDGILVEQDALFKPALAGGRRVPLLLDTCEMEILVVWSVLSPGPDYSLSLYL